MCVAGIVLSGELVKWVRWYVKVVAGAGASLEAGMAVQLGCWKSLQFGVAGRHPTRSHRLCVRRMKIE